VRRLKKEGNDIFRQPTYFRMSCMTKTTANIANTSQMAMMIEAAIRLTGLPSFITSFA